MFIKFCKKDTTSVFHKDKCLHPSTTEKVKSSKKASICPLFTFFSNINLGLQYVNKYT